MAKTLKQIREEAAQLIGEITIDNDTGKIEDDNSSPNKSLQRTPKSIKSVRQQPNVSSQKQLPPPQKTAIANPSRVPVVVKASNVPATVMPKTTLPATQEKKPEEKYMGKVYPEKKPGLSKPEPASSKENKSSVTDKAKPVPPKDDKPTETKPETKDDKTVDTKPVPPNQTKKPIATEPVKDKDSPIVKSSASNASTSNQRSRKLDLRGTATGVGMRYSGPEHLIKAPTRPGRR